MSKEKELLDEYKDKDYMEDIKIKQPLVCPFRKEVHYLSYNYGTSFGVPMSEAEYSEDVFLPCLEEACAMWCAYGKCGMSR
ncbi:MAG: hypothetical protein LIR50_07465 [Bacillota bacterium]|nr:hypothetical protein [Bacillota bacterium]